MEFLIAIGFAAVGIQLAAVPALWAAGKLAVPGRSGSKAALLIAVACAAASIGIQVQTWPTLGRLLQVSSAAPVLAAIGLVSFCRVAFLFVRAAMAPGLGHLRMRGSDGYAALAEALSDAADAMGLSAIPRLAVLECVSSPIVTGLFRPLILFPSKLASLGPDQLRIVLLHELAHLQGRHLLWMQLATSLSQTVWPNPIGAMTVRRFRACAEREADRLVEEMEFTRDEIFATRSEVLRFMAVPQVALPFTGAHAERAGRHRREWGLAGMGLSVVAAFVPLIVLARPGLVGYADSLEPLQSRYVLNFSTKYGQWLRGRYDVIFTVSGNLYRMHGDGHERRLLRPGNFSEPTISRDGTRIVALDNQDGNTELFLMDGEGDQVEQLTDTPLRERQPSLSPDGRKVVYMAVDGDDFEHAQIMLLDLDTRAATNLSKDIGPGIEPKFGPDGKSVLYTYGGRVFQTEPDGRSTRQLTWNDGRTILEDHGPIPSPDGRFIAFTRVVRGLQPTPVPGSVPDQVNLRYMISVWIMDASGENPRELIAPQRGLSESFAYSFAPTGLWLAHDRTRTFKGGPDSSAWEMDVLTGESRPIVTGGNVGISYTGWVR